MHCKPKGLKISIPCLFPSLRFEHKSLKLKCIYQNCGWLCNENRRDQKGLRSLCLSMWIRIELNILLYPFLTLISLCNGRVFSRTKLHVFYIADLPMVPGFQGQSLTFLFSFSKSGSWVVSLEAS